VKDRNWGMRGDKSSVKSGLQEGEMGTKDVRARAKREGEFYRRANVQTCRICGRWFTKRQDDICSRECAEKAAAKPLGDSPIRPNDETAEFGLTGDHAN
jgi:hypothetical protein